ncbi:hypothetical protein QWY31_14625 [Cytophagales bacterium LB-30]|uniref:Outer membrane protein beta-barrel domain-containing protein n=1 Tax=Shiella aurantiaca TaxID=3058365 RepID=A0ABT8F8X9_9BACT|nr:hypothetical protein [Shiella aurantiaca]MDN4166743.1 hypothetical protein [Shiella aurantiaca]
MKKVYLLVLALGLVAGNVHAQSNYYQQDKWLVSPGISFGLIGYNLVGNWAGYSRTGSLVPVSLSVEKGITDLISAGPYVGFYRWGWKDNGSNIFSQGTYTSIGGRVSFHLSQFLNDELEVGIDASKWDFYGSVIAGFELQSFASYNGFDNITDNNVRIILGPVLGIRYKVAPSLGLFLEGGRGSFGVGQFGLTFQL